MQKVFFRNCTDTKDFTDRSVQTKSAFCKSMKQTGAIVSCSASHTPLVYSLWRQGSIYAFPCCGLFSHPQASLAKMHFLNLGEVLHYYSFNCFAPTIWASAQEDVLARANFLPSSHISPKSISVVLIHRTQCSSMGITTCKKTVPRKARNGFLFSDCYKGQLACMAYNPRYVKVRKK